MRKFSVLLFAAIIGLTVVFPALAAELDNVASLPLMTKQMGTRHTKSGVTGLYFISLGDTSWQDAKADRRCRVMKGVLGPFAFNAAQYAPNADGTWRMWNFIPPTPEQMLDWVDYLARPDVAAFLESFDRKQARDFGKQGDFIYARANVPVSELPAPLNRASVEAMAPVLSFFHYNEDGTMRIELRDPDWEEERAEAAFKRLVEEIEKK